MEKKFLTIYNIYKNDVYRLSYSYTKSIFEAEDITQSVFLKYYKNIRKINDESIKNWLIKVTINECKSLFLSSWYRKVRFLKKDDENIMRTKSINSDLLDIIFKLPKDERLIIHLYYYENFKIKDIAKTLKMSEANVKVKLYRIRKYLKNLLYEEGL